MRYAVPKDFFMLFSSLVAVLFFPAFVVAETITLPEVSADSDGTDTVQFVDVSVGASEKESSCIFKVNGKTVVVDWHETVVVDGITIFVQDIYPVNTAAQNEDSCKFLYSSSDSSTKESFLKKTQIGNKLLTFFLGTRADASAAEETNAEETETSSHETPETARVLVDGYDVTADTLDTSDTTGDGVAVAEEIDASVEAPSEETTAATDVEEGGFFSTFFSWIFGKE